MVSIRICYPYIFVFTIYHSIEHFLRRKKSFWLRNLSAEYVVYFKRYTDSKRCFGKNFKGNALI